MIAQHLAQAFNAVLMNLQGHLSSLDKVGCYNLSALNWLLCLLDWLSHYMLADLLSILLGIEERWLLNILVGDHIFLAVQP